MIGYTAGNNDIYVFFERDDVVRLGKRMISGTYVNIKEPPVIGVLKVSVEEDLDDITKTSVIKRGEDVKFMHLKIKGRVYRSFVERGFYESHEGFRHVCLRDINKLDLGDMLNYKQLKMIRDNV